MSGDPDDDMPSPEQLEYAAGVLVGTSAMLDKPGYPRESQDLDVVAGYLRRTARSLQKGTSASASRT